MAELAEQVRDPALDQPQALPSQDEIISHLLFQQRRATIDAINSKDDDPEEAAGSLALAEDTGLPPNLVHADRETVLRNHKDELIRGLINNDPHLQNYINNNDLAAKVSNDDWGQLAELSKKLTQFPSAPMKAMLPLIEAGWRGFEEFYGPGQPLAGFYGNERGMYNPAPYYKGETALERAEMALFLYLPEQFMRLMAGGAGAWGGFEDELLKQTGISSSKWFQNYIGPPGLFHTLAEGAMDPATAMTLEASGFTPAMIAGTFLAAGQRFANSGRVMSYTPEIHRKFEGLKPWFKGREVAPVGIDKDLDELHKKRQEAMEKGFEDIQKAADATNTGERVPDHLKKFILDNPNAQGTVGVPWKVVKALYGDKEPEADDGLLGFIPDLKSKMDFAERHNVDIDVPFADLIVARLENPKLTEALEGNIRLDPEGLTRNEKEELKPPEKEKERTLWKRPEEGKEPATITLRRVEPLEPAKEEKVADWIKESPEYKATIEATGRWFSSDDENVKWYIDHLRKDGIEPKVTTLKLPKEEAERYRVSNLPAEHEARKFSRRPEEEFFLSRELADERVDAPRYTLKELPKGSLDWKDVAIDDNTLAYDIMDGNERAGIVVGEVKGDTAYIHRIAASGPIKENRFGPYALRQLWEQWAEMHPEVNRVAGYRAQGARTVSGNGPTEAIQAVRKTVGLPNITDEGEVPSIGLGSKERTKAWQDAALAYKKAGEEWVEARTKDIANEEAKEEWKQRLKEVREDIRNRLTNQPTLMLDEAIREGTLGGRPLTEPMKINPESLTAEERAGIPENYFSSRGQSADWLANFFQYETREQMLESLRNLEEERQIEGLTPQAHFSKILDRLADREMRDKYGSVDRNLLELARDHVYSPESLRMLASDILEKAMAHADRQPWNDAEVRMIEQRDFLNHTIGEMNEEKFRAQALRNATAAQDAALKGNFIESIRYQQMQYANLYTAKLIRDHNKLWGVVERTIKRNNVLERKGVQAVDHLGMLELMRNAGIPIPHSPTQLAEQREFMRNGQTYREYVEETNSQHAIYNHDVDNTPLRNVLTVDQMFLDPPPPPLRGQTIFRTPETMTIGQREVFADSIRSQESWNLKNNKYTVKGNARELNETVGGLAARVKAASGGVKQGEDPLHVGLRTFGSWLLTPETWFNRIDRGNKRGPFTQLISRPVMEGGYTGRTLEREFARDLKDLGEYPDYNRKIQNPLFLDEEGEPIEMTKGKAYAVLQNMGNFLQQRKLVGGWKIIDETLYASKENRELAIQDAINSVWEWLGKKIEDGGAGMTEKDFARATKLGGIYNKAFRKSQQMYAGLGGYVPNAIDLGQMRTPWGIKDEFYSPLIKDPLHKVNLTPEQIAGEGGGFFRPSPAQGYTKGRTGAIYRIDLDMRNFGPKLKQILNDIAMRPAITEVSKIVYHKDFKAAFTKYYGKEYFAGLDKWLKDSAGNREWQPYNEKLFQRFWVEGNRNLSNLYVGLNPTTIWKHVPTALGQSINETSGGLIGKHSMILLKELPGAQDHWNYAHENSEELRNRMRSSGESITGVDARLFPKPGASGYVKYRDAVEQIGHFPIAMSDLIFSTAQWLADYEKNSKANPTWEHGDLVDAANTAVRRTHGSTMIMARPQILRTSPYINAIVPLYNFASTFLQRNYEAGWLAKQLIQEKILGKDMSLPAMRDFDEEKLKAFPAAKKIVGRIFWSGLMVALWENIQDPIKRETDETLGAVGHYLKIAAMPYSNMIPFVGRDMLSAMIHGREGGKFGLFGSLFQDASNLAPNRIRANPGHALRSAMRFAGLFGLTTDKPFGTTTQYLTNVAAGKERPPEAWDFAKGLVLRGPFWRGTKIERP